MTPDEAKLLTATPVRVLDLAWPSRPPRTLRRPHGGVVLVESVCRVPQIVDRIYMRAHDAAMKLSRYEVV